MQTGHVVSVSLGKGKQAGKLETTISLDPDYTHVCLLRAQLSKTYYNVPAGGNSFSVCEAGRARNITIPEGNYELKNFANAVQMGLLYGAQRGWNYRVSVVDHLGESRLRITLTGDGTGAPIITISAGPRGLYRQLGLVADLPVTLKTRSTPAARILTPYDDPATPPNWCFEGFATMPHPCDFDPHRTIYLLCDRADDSTTPIAALYMGGVPFMGTHVYQNKQVPLNAHRLKVWLTPRVTFSLVGTDGRPIDLRNGHFDFDLVFLRSVESSQ